MNSLSYSSRFGNRLPSTQRIANVAILETSQYKYKIIFYIVLFSFIHEFPRSPLPARISDSLRACKDFLISAHRPLDSIPLSDPKHIWSIGLCARRVLFQRNSNLSSGWGWPRSSFSSRPRIYHSGTRARSVTRSHFNYKSFLNSTLRRFVYVQRIRVFLLPPPHPDFRP